MENWHQVTFSYADETIQNTFATQPDKALTLTESLQILNSETGLQFTILNESFVTITKPTSKGNDFKLQELQEIVVTNYLTSGISLNNNGQIVLKPEKFGILPGLTEPDVLQTIQALPGVMSVDETISNINIRGGTHDQNLILWDGIKMYQSGHFFGMISAFNPYLTKDVEVSKNGTSAQYGDGISGVIDMQNADVLNHKFKAGLGINLIHADGFAKVPLTKNTEVQLSLRRSVTDLFTTPTYDAYFKR
ncbi:MAG TPA: Plug domain-containing protein, partial [Flavobacteriaceae bacterium]|nr:Plug domain-containing protein [Flavobacteriaceae bacterium]